MRRFIRGEPIFSADRGHIHHRLLERGFTPRRAAFLLYAVCGVGAAISLLSTILQNRFAGLLVVLFGAGAWIGVRQLDYAEFPATRRFLWAGFRPTLSAHVKLKLLEQELLGAGNLNECWSALERAGKSMGYTHMTALLSRRRYSTAPDRARHTAFWQMRLNLPCGNYVNITQRERDAQPVLQVPFVEVVGRVLPEKLAQLESSAQLAALASAVESAVGVQPAARNSRISTVISSDCGAPSVNAATAS